ncbi:flavodoxin family protein [Pseudoramibacter alactolyticus]
MIVLLFDAAPRNYIQPSTRKGSPCPSSHFISLRSPATTRQVADTIWEDLSPAYKVIVCDSRSPAAYPEADLCLLCFWCWRATLDPSSQKVLHLYRRQPFLAIGTMGGRPEGAYGERVREKVRQAVDAGNRCQGIFLCRGKIPEARTEYRRALPKDHRLYLDDAGYARHL